MPEIPDKDVIGPFLRFGNYDPDSGRHTTSVLIVTAPSLGDPAALLKYGPTGSEASSTAKLLDEYRGYKFLRFELELYLLDGPQTISYSLEVPGSSISGPWSFHVPSRDEPWRWVFYSCNGYHEKPNHPLYRDGIQPMWKDLMKQHAANPYCAAVGGGDQIYNDPVWDLPSMDAWSHIADVAARGKAEFSAEQMEEVTEYYFSHYCNHFSVEFFADGLASIPHVNSWDDHDVFDGWGSYPDYLQKSPVFQETFAIAKRFYLLFQQHTTAEEAHEYATFGSPNAYNHLKRFGRSTAVLMADTRSERSLHRIISLENLAIIKARVEALPSEVRHLVVVLPVPLMYPKIPLSEGVLTSVSGETKSGVFWGLMNKTGLSRKVMSAFGEPDILDDLNDHWSSKHHQGEKLDLINWLRDVSQRQTLRVTFISGDVHCAGFGRLYSNSKAETPMVDHRYMHQLISSAMGNETPPAPIIQLLNGCARITRFDSETSEEIYEGFPHKAKLHAQRNYLEVTEHAYNPDVRGERDNGVLQFTLRVEHPKLPPAEKMDIWGAWVPILEAEA